MQLLIQRSLNPAKITNMEINEEESRVEVFLRPDEVSKAIGKGGHNIKLASKLTGYEIDVYREGAEDIDDVDLDEFSDEIDSWIIDALKAIGCDSAKSVLEIGKEDLVKRTDLEEETIEEIVKILNSEFEQ
jgi:N utilization substance protein A